MVILAQIMDLTGLNLYDIIFRVILQMPECARDATWGCVSGVFAHDFTYGLFLPHIVLIIFIFGAAQFGAHKGMSTLLGMGIYVFIVYSGWYPLFASLTLFWLVISIVMSTFFFISGKIISPAKAETLGKLASTSKRKRMLKEEIRRIENQLRRHGIDAKERAALQTALHNAQSELSKT